jgi:hypothetical protein
MTKSDYVKKLEQRLEQEQLDTKRVFDLARTQSFPFNRNYRIVGSDQLQQLGEYIETVDARTFDVRYWYANGPVCEDRPNVLASFHPVIHKRDGEWDRIYRLAQDLAKDLKRWIWITVGEDRWARLILGDDPGDASDTKTGPLYDANGKYQNDQYITTVGPNGEEIFVGCS